jgi:small-conductance mechanosensitive channel
MMAKGYAEESSMDQIGLGVSVLLNFLILLIFLPLTLFMWGFQPGDIQAWAQKLATGFSIGSVTISLLGILSGILVFAIGYFLTRWFQGWLDGSVMARGKVDAGVRNSISLVVGYAGIAIAALVGISAAGIDLSSLALVAGALSLGIGFGLQNVVSNFVSGLILLAERPFKVGDWIVAGDVSGTVRKISVRATEIETFQRQTVILPNSNLINGAVGNWTYLRIRSPSCSFRILGQRRWNSRYASSLPISPAAAGCRTTSASRSWTPSTARGSKFLLRRAPNTSGRFWSHGRMMTTRPRPSLPSGSG